MEDFSSPLCPQILSRPRCGLFLLTPKHLQALALAVIVGLLCHRKSVYPLLGESPGHLSPHQVCMAMAVRPKNTHWRTGEIRRRHWSAMGRRNGAAGADGRAPDAIVQDMIERARPALESVCSALPPDFPPALFESVQSGLLAAARAVQVETS